MKMIKKWIACLMAVGMMLSLTACGVSRSEERRAVKECRSRWSQYH